MFRSEERRHPDAAGRRSKEAEKTADARRSSGNTVEEKCADSRGAGIGYIPGKEGRRAEMKRVVCNSRNTPTQRSSEKLICYLSFQQRDGIVWVHGKSGWKPGVRWVSEFGGLSDAKRS
jgi:hypothetical protein